MRQSLRMRIILIFILVAVVPLLLVGVVLIQRTFTAQSAQALVLQARVAQQTAAEVRAFIRERENELRLLTETRGLSRRDEDEQIRLLDGLLTSRAEYEELILLDSQGQELLRRLRLETVDTLGNRAGLPEFEQAKASGKGYYSPIEIDEFGEPFMTIALPLANLQSGEIDNILVAKFRFKNIWDLMIKASSADQTVYMVDNTGRVVAHPNPSVVLQGSQFNLPAEDSFHPGLDGTNVALAFTPIVLGNETLNVVAEQPTSVALNLAFNVTALTVGAIVIGLIISIGLGVFASGQTTRPIVQLATTAQAISAGDLSQQVTVTRRDEIGKLAGAFNHMTKQLQRTLRGLENRTRDLTLAAEVSRRLSTVRDLDVLLAESVELIQNSFSLYYAQIYLTGNAGRSLILRAGSGSVGKQLLRRGHRLPVGPGSINGAAASEKQAVIVSDTTQSATFLPNPLLPDTKSEMAVPLLIGERVMGVLNLQHDEANSLTEENLSTFEALAGQLAIAIENARLFVETEQARAKTEAYARTLSGQGWGEFLNAIDRGERLGFSYAQDALNPLNESLESTANEQTLVVPVAVSGQPIGAIQLEAEPERAWTAAEAELVSVVAQQISQQVENLRLLLQADQYRAEAEAAARRTTRAGWVEYINNLGAASPGFVYDLNEVTPLNGESDDHQTVLSRPIDVRGEIIGELAIDDIEQLDDEATELLAIIAEQLSDQIESARLLENTEKGRQQQEQAAQRLQKEEERFRTVADFTYGWEYWINSDGSYEYVSPSCHRITGYTVDQFMEDPHLIETIIHPDDQAVFAEHMHDYHQEASSDIGEVNFRIITKEGQERWISHLCQPVYGADGAKLGRRASQSDITDRKQAEEQIQQNLTETETRLKINEALAGKRTEAEVLDVLIEQAGLYPEAAVFIELFDQEAEELTAVVQRIDVVESGIPLSLSQGTRFTLSEFSMMQHFKAHETFVSSNYPEDERAADTSQEAARRIGAKSMAVVPLTAGNEWMGAIVAFTAHEGYFDGYRLKLYQTLAEQGAVALRSARLQEETQRSNRELEVRTRELEASQQVTFAASETNNPDELLGIVVNLIRDQFDLYHAQVYIVDEEKQAAVLRESTGYAGQQLLKREHQIPLNNPALVTKAINSGEPVLVADVNQVEDWLPNELLPYTQAELVIPLKVDDQVLGALDVQSRSTNQLTERSVALFRTMADQVTFLFENSELLARITEQAKNLRESQQMTQLVMDHVPQSIFWKDKNLSYLGCNRHFAKAAGMTPEEIVGKTDYDMPWIEQAELHNADDRQVMEASEPKLNFEEPLTTPTGEQIWLRTSKVPMHDAEGNVAAVLGMFEDITDRKQAEVERQQLLRQTQTLHHISERLNEQTDLEGTLQVLADRLTQELHFEGSWIGLFDEPNNALISMAGTGPQMGREDMKGAVVSIEKDKLNPAVLALTTGRPVVINNVQNDERFAALPDYVKDSIGKLLQVPIISGGKKLGTIAVSYQSPDVPDINQSDVELLEAIANQAAVAIERARLFEEIQQTAERLREVDRLKSEFLANMSHELRTPLNSIIGYSEMMLLGISGDMPEEIMEDIQAIYDNGKHLLHVISDILDLAKIEAGRLNLNLEEVHVDSLLDEVKVNNAGLFMNKPIEMVVAAEKNLPLIEADPIRINQILNNLISNAAKFTPEGKVTVSAYRDGDWIALAVEDTGVGMSEEDLNKIFDKFMQVDGSFTRRTEGTGLGLAITRHLIHMHGGEIDVRSKLGKGTTFVVRLPLKQTEPNKELVEMALAA